MMSHAADAAGWRIAAREAIVDKIAPHDIVWSVSDGPADVLARPHLAKAAPTFRPS